MVHMMLEIGGAGVERLEELMRRHGLGREQVLREALTLYLAAVAETSRGRQLVLFEPGSGNIATRITGI